MTTPPKGRADYLALGDWNVVCYECGRKRKASYMKRHWQGYYVCPEHWEVRHPQDFVRGIADVQTPPWTQPMPPDEFVPINYSQFPNDPLPLLEFDAKDYTKNIHPPIGSGAVNSVPVDTLAVNASTAPPQDFERFFITETFLAILGRSLSDAFGFSEGFSADAVKGLSEPVVLAETLANNFTKTVPMTVVPSDGLVNGGVVNFAEVNGTSPLAVNAERLFFAEVLTFNITPRFVESLGISESLAFSLTRGIAESVSVNESTMLADVSNLQESLGLAEANTVSITKGISESVGLTESQLMTLTSRNVVNGAAVNTTPIG